MTKIISALSILFVLLISQAQAGEKKPLSVIIMIADGCGFEDVKACDIYTGKKGVYEKFPVRLAMSTFAAGGSYDPKKAVADKNYLKKNPTDSAAAATAMACGIKTYRGAIGVDTNKKAVENILEAAEKLGKSAGVVTTVPFSHATPAGFAVHNISRGNYIQIADEMINKSALEVIIGAGNPYYNDDGKRISHPDFKYISAVTLKKLKVGIAGNDCDGDAIADKWTYIESIPARLKNYNASTPKRLFCLARAGSTLQEKRSGDKNAKPFTVALNKSVPTLSDITAAALNVLDNNPKGFVLMIEGGAVDWAGHANESGRMIEEMVDFNKAVETVLNWAKETRAGNHTLIIVTADHETGFLQTDKKNGKLVMRWRIRNHTNSLVPFYAKGADAEMFEKLATRKDPLAGRYIDNTDIAKVVFTVLKGTSNPLIKTRQRAK